MKDKPLSVEDQLNTLQVKVNKIKPVPRQTIDPSARVLDALGRGEDLVARKFFQGAGKEYQPGEKIDPEGWGNARLAQMAKVGYIVPAGEYSQSMEYVAARDLLENKLTPLRSTLQQARQQAQNAAILVASKAAELAQAKQDASQAAVMVEHWENELLQALKGEDVQALLA